MPEWEHCPIVEQLLNREKEILVLRWVYFDTLIGFGNVDFEAYGFSSEGGLLGFRDLGKPHLFINYGSAIAAADGAVNTRGAGELSW